MGEHVQVLDGILASGNRYRITPYVMQITSDTGALIRNVEIQALGDSSRAQNVLTCWMRDGSAFSLGFSSDAEAKAALAVIHGGSRPTAPATTLSAVSPLHLVVALCAISVVVGSIGPWASIWIVTAGGLDGDGQITLVLGLVALIGLALRVRLHATRLWIMLGVTAALGIAALIGAYDWANIGNAIGDLDDNVFAMNASVGWGLQLMTISAFIGATAAVIDAVDLRRDS